MRLAAAFFISIALLAITLMQFETWLQARRTNEFFRIFLEFLDERAAQREG